MVTRCEHGRFPCVCTDNTLILARIEVYGQREKGGDLRTTPLFVVSGAYYASVLCHRVANTHAFLLFLLSFLAVVKQHVHSFVKLSSSARCLASLPYCVRKERLFLLPYGTGTYIFFIGGVSVCPLVAQAAAAAGCIFLLFCTCFRGSKREF